VKHEEWLEVGRKQLGLWPTQPWEPPTMAAAYDLFRDVPAAFALQALEELAASGREFAPAPGVVAARALQLVIDSRPALMDPDVTRDLTPQERERARLMAAALNGDKARLVQATWLVWAQHGRLGLNEGEIAEVAAARITACDGRCDRVASRIRRGLALTSRAIDGAFDELCAEGRPMFEAWREAVFNLNAFDAVQQEARL